MKSIKWCHLSKTMDRIQAWIAWKNAWRLASTWRSTASLSARHSNTVWNRKASRVRLSRNAERYCVP
jgi:hypothetical protein